MFDPCETALTTGSGSPVLAVADGRQQVLRPDRRHRAAAAAAAAAAAPAGLAGGAGHAAGGFGRGPGGRALNDRGLLEKGGGGGG